MPSMTKSSAPVNPRPTEGEIVDRALQAARSGEIAKAVQALQLPPERGERLAAAEATVGALSAQNPALGAEVALALPAGPTRFSILETATLMWIQKSPDEALVWAIGIQDSERGAEARRATASALVKSTPNQPLERISALPVSPAREELFIYTAGSWTGKTPDAALSWLRDQPQSAFRDRLAFSMVFQLAQTNPTLALEMVESLPSGRNRWLVVSEIGKTWVAVNPDAAMKWASQLEATEAREAAVAGINTGLGIATTRRSPRFPSSGVVRGRSAYALSGGADLPAFANWLATQPRALSRDEAILEFVRQRGSQDSGAIGFWLANLGSEPAKQQAMEIYLEEILRGSPSSAINWLRSLSSSERSIDMLEKTANALLRSNPTAAEAWIRESELPTDRKDILLRQIMR